MGGLPYAADVGRLESAGVCVCVCVRKTGSYWQSSSSSACLALQGPEFNSQTTNIVSLMTKTVPLKVHSDIFCEVTSFCFPLAFWDPVCASPK
jgi:hypothetical protein